MVTSLCGVPFHTSELVLVEGYFSVDDIVCAPFHQSRHSGRFSIILYVAHPFVLLLGYFYCHFEYQYKCHSQFSRSLDAASANHALDASQHTLAHSTPSNG